MPAPEKLKMRGLPICLLTLFALCLASVCQGQAPGLQGRPADFPILFPHPTGQNGYEEFVRAEDLIKNSEGNRLYDQTYADNDPVPLTLTLKRKIVSDPDVQQAFVLLHTGVQKAVQSPHIAMDDDSPLPEMSGFRALARMLRVELDVLLADGKTGAALDTFADGLQFGYLLQKDTLVAGLAATNIDTILILQFSRHLPQFSARDCDRLLRIAKDWLSLPDPAGQILENDRQMHLRTLKKYRENPAALAATFNPGPDADPESQRVFSALSAALKGDAESVSSLFDQTAVRLNARYDEAIRGLQKPVWERKEDPTAENSPQNSPAALLANTLQKGFLGTTISRYVREQVFIQLLGIQAALLRYHWEYDKMPANLEDLKLGRLLLDPYSGKSMLYKPVGDHDYQLSSAGPLAPGTTERPASGQRSPLTLPVRP